MPLREHSGPPDERSGPCPRARSQHWCQSRLSLPAQSTQPPINIFLSGPDLRIADTAVLRKCALSADGADTNAVSVTLEDQAIPTADSQNAANLARNCNLSLARDRGFLLHIWPLSLLYHICLTMEIMTLLPTPECMFHQFETAILYN